MELHAKSLILFTLLFCQANQQIDVRHNKGLIESQCLNCDQNSDECTRSIEGNRLTFVNCGDEDIGWIAKVIAQETSVVAIDISHSGLRTMNGIDLHQNRKLKNFTAAYNNLNKFPLECLGGAPVIEEVDFSVNRLAYIELHTFEGLSTLTTINLSFNNINFVEKNAFIKLNHLINVDLSYNQLATIDKLQFCAKCKVTLHLKGNPLGWSQGSWADLLVIDLREDPVRFRAVLDDKKEGIFPSTDGTSMMEVHCSDQRFKLMLEFSIAKNQMENLPALLQCMGSTVKRLNLNGNFLGALNRTVFQRFTSLEVFMVADTQLAEFDFGLMNDGISSLDLSFNGLTSLANVAKVNEFGAMHDFKMAGNRIQNMHDLIRYLPADSPYLYVLDISDSFLGPLNQTTFERFTMVATLKLRNTGIAIANFDPFKPLWKLYDLDISNNNFENVDFSVLAKTLQKLHMLYASNCQIRNISEVIQYLGQELAELDLSNNFAHDLNEHLFKSFSKLNKFNLSNTNIKHFAPEIFQHLHYISDIDFSNNQLQELDFRLMPSDRVRELHINNNRLQRIMNLNHQLFSPPSKVNVAYNCLTDDFVNQILRNVTGIEFVTDPTKQKSNEECANHEKETNTVFIAVISVTLMIILCVCLVYRNTILYLLDKLKMAPMRSQPTTEPISNQINQIQSIKTTEIVTMDEPIYEELDDYLRYDKLWHEFHPKPVSKETQEMYNTSNRSSMDAPVNDLR